MTGKPATASDFSGRVALVTGGASGIGLAVAEQLFAGGATVAIADRNVEGAKAAAESISRSDERIRVFGVDVSNPQDACSMVDGVVDAFGRLDILVHSAGIGVERGFLETTPEEWRKIIDIDLSGTFFCGQAAAKVMAHNAYGRIVNIASTAGLRGGTGRAAYGAAKGGVVALTKVMAVELAPLGITVNALAPGAIETELVARMHSAETRKAYLGGIPMDRYGTPGETAAAAVFLASDKASYISGHILSVDGGFLAAGVMIR